MGFFRILEAINIHKNIVSFIAIFGIGYLSLIIISRNSFLEKMEITLSIFIVLTQCLSELFLYF